MDVMSVAAENAAQRYRGLLAGLGGVYQQAALTPKLGRDSALQAAYRLADSYLDAENLHIDELVTLAAETSRQETLVALNVPQNPMTDEQAAHVAAIVDDLDTALRVQIERDLASLNRALRENALTQALKGNNYLPGVVSVSGKTPSFVYLDRASRKWRPDVLVRSIWRQSLVFSSVETAMLTMVEYGVTSAVVDHPSDTYEHIGIVVTLDGSSEDLTWDDVREPIFHPNTLASLKPEVSDA